MMYEDIETLIEDYGFAGVVLMESFNAVRADGLLKTAHGLMLWGIQNKNKNIIGYAVDHYHTGLQQGCFGVREVELIHLDDWNSRKRFYKRVSREFFRGLK